MRKSLSVFITITVTVFLFPAGAGKTAWPSELARGTASLRSSVVRLNSDFGKMPVYFVPNTGQMDRHVAYYIQGKEKTLYFTAEGITFSLINPAAASSEAPAGGTRGKSIAGSAASDTRKASCPGRWIVKLDFVGGDRNVMPAGDTATNAAVSYFKGKPEEWRRGLPTYSRIVYRSLWPGIDLVCHGSHEKLKYEFIVHAGADPSDIRLAYRGASDVKIDAAGRLEVETPFGGFRDDTPAAYQESEGRRAAIPMAYRLFSPNEKGRADTTPESFIYGFEIGAYDQSRTLVLDPAFLIYCGYIGGNGGEDARAIAMDAAGNAYITGTTFSTETTFPVTVGPDTSYEGNLDAFVAKLSATGSGLIYCGFIGGAYSDYGYGIAVDGAGCAYVVGTTNSGETTFPVTVGPDLTHGQPGGYPDAFVAKVSSSGEALVYCGYIGGRDQDEGYGVAVDGSGCAYVTGFTTMDETLFPTLVGPDLTFNGVVDAFVTKVSASGAGLVYSGYIGGLGADYGYGIAVDSSGRAYIVGRTFSDAASFPAKVGPVLTKDSSDDVFIARVSASGSGLDYGGFIGGDNTEESYSVAVDGSGCAYVAGFTLSTEATFPLTIGPDMSSNGGYDAFVAKVSGSGDHLEYCGFIGGQGADYGYGIAVDNLGNAYITGETSSTEYTFPVVGGPDLTYNGNRDAFVAKVTPGGYGLAYCGYIGGGDRDMGLAVAVDGSNKAHVAGKTKSAAEANFPVLRGPDLIFNGFEDAFVAKVSSYDPPLVFGGDDFDGNGAADIAIYRPADGIWFIQNGATQQWGYHGDVPVQGQYDLNATSDIAVWRPSYGIWFIYGIAAVQWGTTGDIPVPHDYDGNGVTDLAVWRPSSGVWYVNGIGYFQWGQDGDYPVPGDYNGDNIDEIAVWRPESGTWYIYGGGYYQWGTQGDIPVPADYDGDTKTDVAIYRPSTGTWYIKYSSDNGTAVQWGTIGDIPVPGDYDGDATTEIAVWRPSNGLWYIYGIGVYQWGKAGDIPLVR